MNKDKEKPNTDSREHRTKVLLAIVFAAYIAACITMYIIADINERSAYVNVSPAASDAELIPDSEKVNINTATLEELTTLDGIGEVTAAKIIEYRDTYGGFLYIDELLNVNGIGEKLLKKIKPYITL